VVQQAPTGASNETSNYEEMKLRVGVPMKNGFRQFVDVVKDTTRKEKYNITGYCMDVFNAVLTRLPFNVSLNIEPYPVDTSEGSGYDDLLKQIPSKVSKF